MTITAPLTTESGGGSDRGAVDEVTLDLTDTGAPEVEAVETSLLRDPLLPFLVLGTLAFAAIIAAAFLLSSGSVTL